MKKHILRRLCMVLGVGLIVLSLGLLVAWQAAARENAKSSQETVAILRELLPEPQWSIMEERTNNDMPRLNVADEDFVAILEFPANNAALPVGADWRNHNAHPCLYSGSAYDGSLIIGTSNQAGQLDFVPQIAVGDAVYVTDMTGSCYSYRVRDVHYRDNADNDTLLAEDDDLTIFVKNVYGFEYIIIRCDG